MISPGLIANLLLAAAAHGFTGDTVVLVNVGDARVEVSGQLVRLGDVAGINVLAKTPDEAHRVEMRARRLEIGRFDQASSSIVIDRAAIARALSLSGFARDGVNIDGAPRVEVRRRTVVIGGDRIERLARRHILDVLRGEERPTVVRAAQALPSVEVPAGRWRVDLRFDADPKNTAWAGEVRLLLAVEVDGKVIRRMPVPMIVRRPVEVVRARRRVRAGKSVTSDDLELVRMEPTRPSGELITSFDQVIGLVVKRDLAIGQTVTRHDLKALPVIGKDDLVIARARIGSLLVETLCRARQDGAPGERIVLENVESKKTVYAIVRDARTVEVILGR